MFTLERTISNQETDERFSLLPTLTTQPGFSFSIFVGEK
jgi:hypothetical protein